MLEIDASLMQDPSPGSSDQIQPYTGLVFQEY